MVAMAAKLPSSLAPPKVYELGRSIRAGPFFCCVTDIDGQIIARNIPIVMRTERNSMHCVGEAIVDYVEFRSFTCTDLKEYADELTHHIKRSRSAAVIGS